MCKIVCYGRHPIVIIRESNDNSDFMHVFVVSLCIVRGSFFASIFMNYVSSDLADLVEIIHKVVKLMDSLQSRGTLRVS